jgi:hypothetical protein
MVGAIVAVVFFMLLSASWTSAGCSSGGTQQRATLGTRLAVVYDKLTNQSGRMGACVE